MTFFFGWNERSLHASPEREPDWKITLMSFSGFRPWTMVHVLRCQQREACYGAHIDLTVDRGDR